MFFELFEMEVKFFWNNTETINMQKLHPKDHEGF